ncbi:MAG: putative outer membrane efflux protein [Candidatus Scalindua rubra]|uniref:Putative outer membrane efflux protein n=1 Tax=Candidatus Scalindua rubra TaxID=1872076 RepID=A0A1E3XCB7_9BACT|nr:MAG: putative outer membrane efflux protein [Candidatus Scalindua rubra]
MFSKLKKILAILFSLNLIIFANTNVEARNDYAEALREILEVAPKGDIEAKDEYEELEKPAVEFSKDMKFLNITLKDSIILALHNNYDIRIAKLEPMIEEKDITVAKSEFDPTLKITGDVEDSEVPSNSQLQVGLGAGLGDFRDDSNTLNATIEKPLETGATFTLEYNLERRFLDPPPFAIFNPSATASIETKITQPLLKGAGIFYNRSNIYIARNDKKKSILELRDKARTTIKDVQKKYWELVGAIEDLRVKNKSIERARKLLRENKIQVKVGTMAPIEVLVAEEDVASQYEKVIEAENKVKDKEDELKQVMNLSNNSIFSDVAIIPLDKASFEIKEVSLDESIKTALESRPDLFKEGIEIENKRIKVKQQKNQLLPKFDFEAGIRYQGLAGNKGNAIDSAFSQDFQSEFFGVTLEIPLGNREARSNYSKAKLEERKSIIETRKKEQEIVVEVRKAVRQIKTNAEKIRATKKAEELAQKKTGGRGKKSSRSEEQQALR